MLGLWERLLEHQKAINISAVFSYETIANLHIEICSLYAHLFATQPCDQLADLVISDESRRLAHMIDTFLHSSSHSFSHNSEDYTQLTTVRIKFASGVLSDRALFESSRLTIEQFDAKLINLIIFAYLNSNLAAAGSGASATRTEMFIQTSSSSGGGATLVEKELVHFVTQCVAKLGIFTQLGVEFEQNSDMERFLNSFIKRFEERLRALTNFNERKQLVENLNVYLHDFLRMITAINSITTHAIIYKCYLLASQIVSHLAVYLHSRVSKNKIIDNFYKS